MGESSYVGRFEKLKRKDKTMVKDNNMDNDNQSVT